MKRTRTLFLYGFLLRLKYSIKYMTRMQKQFLAILNIILFSVLIIKYHFYKNDRMIVLYAVFIEAVLVAFITKICNVYKFGNSLKESGLISQFLHAMKDPMTYNLSAK